MLLARFYIDATPFKPGEAPLEALQRLAQRVAFAVPAARITETWQKAHNTYTITVDTEEESV